MPNLESFDWVFLASAVLLIVGLLAILKVSYTVKGFLPLPLKKPRFALLPKYVVSLPVDDTDVESDLSSRFAHYGFREVRRDANTIMFCRGSALGDFSVKIAKIIATTSFPVSNPVQLKIEYGVVFGCAFDTGDLWKFCKELAEKIEASLSQDSDPVETGNPYQPPQSG